MASIFIYPRSTSEINWVTGNLILNQSKLVKRFLKLLKYSWKMEFDPAQAVAIYKCE